MNAFSTSFTKFSTQNQTTDGFAIFSTKVVKIYIFNEFQIDLVKNYINDCSVFILIEYIVKEYVEHLDAEE